MGDSGSPAARSSSILCRHCSDGGGSFSARSDEGGPPSPTAALRRKNVFPPAWRGFRAATGDAIGVACPFGDVRPSAPGNRHDRSRADGEHFDLPSDHHRDPGAVRDLTTTAARPLLTRRLELPGSDRSRPGARTIRVRGRLPPTWPMQPPLPSGALLGEHRPARWRVLVASRGRCSAAAGHPIIPAQTSGGARSSPVAAVPRWPVRRASGRGPAATSPWSVPRCW